MGGQKNRIFREKVFLPDVIEESWDCAYYPKDRFAGEFLAMTRDKAIIQVALEPLMAISPE